MQINRFPGNTKNIQTYEKLFCSVSIQFLTQFFWILHQPPYFSLPGMCALGSHSLLIIAMFQIDFVILSQSIDLQLPILLMQWTSSIFRKFLYESHRYGHTVT